MAENLIQNSKVLVTGGAGFIGSNLCETLLNQNNEVVCLDNFITGHKHNIEPFLSNDNFTLIEGDIRNTKDCEKAVDGVDYVLHQAALGSVPRSVENPHTTNDINVAGFLNMLDAAKKANVKRFVYASSSSVYGDATDAQKTENSIGKPLSPYAVSKRVNELYAQTYFDLYGLEVIGLRYFNVFGKRQDPEGAYAAAIPKFCKLLIEGKSPIVYGDGTQTRDFTYIENVVQANQLAALITDKEAINKVYNVAYGEITSVNELIQNLKDLMKEELPYLEGIEVEYDGLRPGEVKHSCASIARAKQMLGYSPTHNIQKGLQQYVKWFLKENAKQLS